MIYDVGYNSSCYSRVTDLQARQHLICPRSPSPCPALRGGQVGKREILNGLKEKQTTVFNYIQNFAGKLWAGSRDYTRR